jgi:hypothetical protein
MNWSYDSALRLDVATAKNGANTLQAADYDYEAAGRLSKVKEVGGNVEALYGYHAISMLTASVVPTNGAGTTQGLGITRAYDKLNRLTSISSKAYGSGTPTLTVARNCTSPPA